MACPRPRRDADDCYGRFGQSACENGDARSGDEASLLLKPAGARSEGTGNARSNARQSLHVTSWPKSVSDAGDQKNAGVQRRLAVCISASLPCQGQIRDASAAFQWEDFPLLRSASSCFCRRTGQPAAAPSDSFDLSRNLFNLLLGVRTQRELPRPAQLFPCLPCHAGLAQTTKGPRNRPRTVTADSMANALRLRGLTRARAVDNPRAMRSCHPQLLRQTPRGPGACLQPAPPARPRLRQDLSQNQVVSLPRLFTGQSPSRVARDPGSGAQSTVGGGCHIPCQGLMSGVPSPREGRLRSGGLFRLFHKTFQDPPRHCVAASAQARPARSRACKAAVGCRLGGAPFQGVACLPSSRQCGS